MNRNFTDQSALPLNRVVVGDCLDVLNRWPPGSIDLAYLDPPFNTGRTMSASNGCYADSWPGIQEYLDYMLPRIRSICDVLKPSGSVLLHCDWRTCHHFRLMLDDLLGPERFVNHLVWRYGLGGSSPRRFARKHDDILFYAKRDDYYFDPPRVPATSNRMRGQTKKASDVIDIPSINNMALERCGYPTQKPMALLKLLIRACCPASGVVLDPFCGSGTTLLAAKELQRNFIGIDANSHAVCLAESRLQTTALVP